MRVFTPIKTLSLVKAVIQSWRDQTLGRKKKLYPQNLLIKQRTLPQQLPLQKRMGMLSQKRERRNPRNL